MSARNKANAPDFMVITSEWDFALKNLGVSPVDTPSPPESNKSSRDAPVLIIPRSAGLWMARRREVSSDEEIDRQEVECAEKHILELMKDPYYFEALVRLSKAGVLDIDGRRLKNDVGTLAGSFQRTKERQSLSSRHLNFGNKSKLSESDSLILVFCVEMEKSAAKSGGENISDHEALMRVMRRKRPDEKPGAIARMVRSKISPRLSKARNKLSHEQILGISKAASKRWQDIQ